MTLNEIGVTPYRCPLTYAYDILGIPIFITYRVQLVYDKKTEKCIKEIHVNLN